MHPLNRRINVARIYECNLSGIDLDAFNLFKLFKGVHGPGSEFEFHLQLNKTEWIKLARYFQRLSLQRQFKDLFK